MNLAQIEEQEIKEKTVKNQRKCTKNSIGRVD